MRYRLKSDPSVECEAERGKCGKCGNESFTKMSVYDLEHLRWGVDIPTWLFDLLWEPIPEPAAPVLPEDELEQQLNIHKVKDVRPGSLFDACRRAIEELRRLRHDCISLTADVDRYQDEIIGLSQQPRSPASSR